MIKRRVATIIPYYRANGEIFIFLQKRDKNAKRNPNVFALFGGGIEENESSEQALVREMKEELSLDISGHEFFNRYEFYFSANDVYTVEVKKDFSDKITVLEGEYGKFFTKEDITKEEKLTLGNRLILNDFFETLK